MQSQSNESLQCRVEKVVFPKDDQVPEGQQFYIIKTSIGTVKGKLTWKPVPEERLILSGKWEASKYNGGLDFSFTSGRHDIPADERSMLTYACELTVGIGPATEEAIWTAKGDKWREVSQADAIPKMTSMTINAFQDTISKLGMEKEKLEAISYLISKGATIRLAESAWEAWKESAISRVEADCYVLADLKNFSFRDVDSRIRGSFGIGTEDPRRVVAAVFYFMKQLSQSSTLVTWRELNQQIKNTIDASPQKVCDIIRDLSKEGRIILFPYVQSLSLDTIYADEKMIWEFVSEGAR